MRDNIRLCLAMSLCGGFVLCSGSVSAQGSSTSPSSNPAVAASRAVSAESAELVVMPLDKLLKKVRKTSNKVEREKFAAAIAVRQPVNAKETELLFDVLEGAECPDEKDVVCDAVVEALMSVTDTALVPVLNEKIKHGGFYSRIVAIDMAAKLQANDAVPSHSSIRHGIVPISDRSAYRIAGHITGGWSSTNAMPYAQTYGEQVLLANGKVLATGGAPGVGGDWVSQANSAIYDPLSGTWSMTGSMNVARQQHAAVLLRDGRVLVAGGLGSGGAYLDSAELYDPETGRWEMTAAMHIGRRLPGTVMMNDGRVLVAGGATSATTYTNMVEIYDPANGKWTTTGSMNTSRTNGPGMLLANGNVLVIGGGNEDGNLIGCELYDVSTGRWSATGSLTYPHGGSRAAYLPGGKVLLVGGGGANGALSVAEVYDPATGQWTETGSMSEVRYIFGMSALKDGRVLVAGGQFEWSHPPLTSAELYDPATGIWNSVGSMDSGHGGNTAILLPSGKVLVAGGETYGSDLYNPYNAAGPVVAGINPTDVPATKTMRDLTITGRNFHAGATVKLKKAGVTDITPENVNVVSVGTITCRLPVSVGAGTWTVAVRNVDGQESWLSDGLNIVRFTALTPSFSEVNISSVSVTWAGVDSNSYVVMLSSGINKSHLVSSATVIDSTHYTFTGLLNDTTYYFAVKVSTESDAGYLENRISTTTLQLPPVPCKPFKVPGKKCEE